KRHLRGRQARLLHLEDHRDRHGGGWRDVLAGQDHSDRHAGVYRGTSPDALGNVMLTGINIPVRIGPATVMPGDVVLGDEEGLLFIPPHLVQTALDAADSTRARDEWIK